MIGAIAGDIIGSVHEFDPIKTKDFVLFDPRCRFTDDSVLTIAIADAILKGRGYGEALQDWGRRYPAAGYGGTFNGWIHAEEPQPYNSWGNGSAMRVSPVGFAFDSEEEVLREAEESARVSHNHPEGIKGAQATALAIFLARTGQGKDEIREQMNQRFGYDMDRSVDEIRPAYSFDVSCQGSVPESIIAFLDASSYEDTVRNAVSLGGDSDTMACIAGGIAEAFYGAAPESIRSLVRTILTPDLNGMLDSFRDQFLT